MKGYSCQIVVDEALTWLNEKRDAKEPFFLNLWFNEPHAPIAAPDEIVSEYGALNDQAAIYSGTIDNTDRAIGRLDRKTGKTRRAREHHHCLRLRQRQLPTGA
jgi:arylsulfatase A